MLNRTLILALCVALTGAVSAHAQEAEASASPDAEEASAAPSAAPSAAAEASPASAAPSAAPSPAASAAEASPAAGVPAAAAAAPELVGTYGFDIDFILEQQPDYAKFTPEQKKAAHDKATADSPKLEVVISADRVKISENGTVKTDASYKVVKKNGTTYALELTDTLSKEKKADVVNFDLQGTRLKMTKEGDKEVLVWIKTK